MRSPQSHGMVAPVPAGFSACLFRYMLSRNPFREPPAPPAGPSLLTMLVVVNLVTWAVPTLYGLQATLRTPPGAVSLHALVNGEWWTMFTHLFTHAGFSHLAANMLFLVLAGRPVLRDAGWLHFLCIYIIGGTAGALASMALHPDLALVGASSAVAALFGVFASVHPEWDVMRPLRGILPLRLRARNLFWGLAVMQVVLAVFMFLFPAEASRVPALGQISHAGHAAGLLVGWIYGLRLRDEIAPDWNEDFFPQGLRRQRRRVEEPVFAPVSRPLREFTADEETPEPLPAPRELTDQEFIRERVDPILEKVAGQGIESLTESERAILEEGSRRMEKRR